MKIPHVPQRFSSKRDRDRWRRVAKDLISHGLDPQSRVELISDYVDAETHIASLRDQRKGSADVRLAQARALNVATAERRRLHQRLFAGAKRPEEISPTVEQRAEKIAGLATNEADEAWRRHFHPRGSRRLICNTGDPVMDAAVEAWNREGEELERRYGVPSWNALLYSTIEAQAEAERKLDAYYAARPSKKRQLEAEAAAKR